MSTISQRNSTSNQLTTDYNLQKIFLLNNRYETDVLLENPGYSSQTILAGTVLGRIAASGNVIPCISGALDGSQYPIGILAQDVNALAQGATQTVAMCVDGDVNGAAIIWYGGDSLSTIANGRTNQDWLKLYGILIRYADEMTAFDN